MRIGVDGSMLRCNVVAVQECDATMLNWNTNARYIISFLEHAWNDKK